ncbi:MAG: hypothetical protein O2960_23690, partial [Verrucomicrobia bacterium]|nr:hypothetical protein [Verrucomicrobiota bacterium]
GSGGIGAAGVGSGTAEGIGASGMGQNSTRSTGRESLRNPTPPQQALVKQSTNRREFNRSVLSSKDPLYFEVWWLSPPQLRFVAPPLRWVPCVLWS